MCCVNLTLLYSLYGLLQSVYGRQNCMGYAWCYWSWFNRMKCNAFYFRASGDGHLPAPTICYTGSTPLNCVLYINLAIKRHFLLRYIEKKCFKFVFRILEHNSEVIKELNWKGTWHISMLVYIGFYPSGMFRKHGKLENMHYNENTAGRRSGNKLSPLFLIYDTKVCRNSVQESDT